jgi:hypothetical protein
MPSTVTDALFGAIAARDQHCRWPGCHKKPIHCDIHHLHYQENGRPNTPCNLLVRLRRNGPAAAPRNESCVTESACDEVEERAAPPKPPSPQFDNPDSHGPAERGRGVSYRRSGQIERRGRRSAGIMNPS